MAVKFFKAPMWEGKLVSIGNGLGERKTQITFALTIHTAVGVDKMNAQAVEMQAKLDLVLQYVVEQKTPTEIEWEKEMDKLGGREACMTDPSKMAKISAIFAARDGASNIEADTKGTDADAAASKSAKKDKDSLSIAQKHALSASVDDLIEENSTLYERKLFQQTEQIKDAIATSTTLILSRLDAGPHELIKHPVRILPSVINWVLTERL
jgi:cystathionine beta-lyase/cystathionine gamma-synthase